MSKALIEELKAIYNKVNEQEDFEAKYIETAFSLTLIITDKSAAFEEHTIIDRDTLEVFIIDEAHILHKEELKKFVDNLKENWSEFL